MKKLLGLACLLFLFGCGPTDRVIEGVLTKVTIEHPSVWGRGKERTSLSIKERTIFTFEDGNTLMIRGAPEGFAYQEGKRTRITIEPTKYGNRIKKLEILN
jgi:hypothetical protein